MNAVSPVRIRPLAEPPDIKSEYVDFLQPNERHFNLTDYWYILIKRRRTVIIIFFVVTAVAAYFPLTATQLYTATATLKIEPQNPLVTAVKTVETLDAGDDYYPTQFALLKTPSLAARVIKDLDIDLNEFAKRFQAVSPNPIARIQSAVVAPLRSLYHYLFPSSEPDSEAEVAMTVSAPQDDVKKNVRPELIDRYQKAMSIAPVLKTRLVQVQFTTPRPRLSQALANLHVQSFVRMSLEGRFNLTKEAREFLEKKVIELRQQMEASEAALNSFRRAHGVVSVEKGDNIVIDRLVELNKQLTTARAQRIEAESLYRTVEDKNHQDLAELMKQGLVQQLKSNVANLETEKARFSTIFKPDHPRIRELGKHIAAARQALKEELDNVVRGIQSGYAAALAKERGLQAEADKQQQAALRMKELGVDYTVLQEQVNANRSLYEGVLKRISETNLASDLPVSNLQIVETADKPLYPSSPNIPLYLLASIILGSFFGIGTALLLEYIDSTVGTPDDVSRSLGLSTLGVVPHLKFLARRRYNDAQITAVPSETGESSEPTHAGIPAKELIVRQRSSSIITESYRNIRTSLLLSQAEKPPQVVLLTSPAPGEGKSVTTLNLGIALAQDGYSVLILDGDMRQGRCHIRLGMRNNKGLCNILTGGLPVDNGIQATSVDGLSLLSRGNVPPNPTELLGSLKMREVIGELRQEFKFILIDSPPVLAVSDAAVLSVLSDGVILVLDGQRTSTSAAQKAVKRLDTVRAPLIGVILNAVNLDDPHYSYFRSYSSYYHDRLPDEDELSDETNGNGQSKADHNFSRLSTIARFWSTKTHRKTATAHAVGDYEPVPNGGKPGDESISTDEPSNARKFSLFPTELSEDLPAFASAKRQDTVPVSQERLNQLAQALTEAIGPIAPLVIREQIAALGESESAFPQRRIGELLERLYGELTGDGLLRFQSKIPKDLQKSADPER
ncbi:MAG: GumC family protein [Candidatus Binatia bacterium]